MLHRYQRTEDVTELSNLYDDQKRKMIIFVPFQKQSEINSTFTGGVKLIDYVTLKGLNC